MAEELRQDIDHAPVEGQTQSQNHATLSVVMADPITTCRNLNVNVSRGIMGIAVKMVKYNYTY